ncbi:MAG: hypothetical protein HC875_33780 [Anaerolineales bacterium]|nr:hypothetical protein [Anaerolineales bacterium]
MDKNQKILDLYNQRKNEGLTALALACGYAELLLDDLFGDLTPDQHELVTHISQAAPKAIAFWGALDIGPDLKMNLPPPDYYNLYQILRNEGLTPIFKMKGFAEVLLKQNLTDKQSEIMKLILRQCEIIQECWWYPEYNLNLEGE